MRRQAGGRDRDLGGQAGAAQRIRGVIDAPWRDRLGKWAIMPLG
jgi:hypothetical protein